MHEEIKGDNWDSHWERYAAAVTLNPAQQLRHDAILEVLKGVHGSVPRLLDIGSGQGDFLARAVAARAATAYAGFELSETGVAVSRVKVPQAQFVQVNLLGPSSNGVSFTGWATAAVCSEVIEHVDDPVAFLSTLRGYLADHALLVLTVPGGPMSTFDKHIGHRRHYTMRVARQVLIDSGFRVDRVRLAGFPFHNLYRLVVILRGKRLISDVESKNGAAATGIARLMMRVFHVLFHFNLYDCPFGWQIIAIARKEPSFIPPTSQGDQPSIRDIVRVPFAERLTNGLR